MSFLFGKAKSKSPAEQVKLLKEALDGNRQEEVSKQLVQIKSQLYADEQEDSLLMISELYAQDMPLCLVKAMPSLEFEAKKEVVQIMNNLNKRQLGTRIQYVEYIQQQPQLLDQLIRAYTVQDIALQCGLILREAIKYEPLTQIIYDKGYFWQLFDYVDLGTFDLASDAFATFKEVLIRHRLVTAQFIEQKYAQFFEKYDKLLLSDNYVTKRQSLKLLGELLLDRSNFNVMTKYISSTDNLKLQMNLLRDKSKNIQFEAFHVFKVFVANPNKTQQVKDILVKNKDKLVKFLSDFCVERVDDEQFNDEKAFLIKQIQDM